MPIGRRRIEGRRSTDHGKYKSCKRYDASDERPLDAADRAEAIAGICRGLEQVDAGLARPLEEFDAEMRRKHGIPRDA